MKRYLIIMVTLIVIVLAGNYLYFVKGFYFNFNKENTILTPFYIEDKVIYQTDGHKKIEIRGVELDSSYGPKRGTDYSIDEETYLRWFKEIQQMGANTIRISTIYDDQFYKAFYKYNKDNKQPLYLIQGIRAATDEFETKRKIDQFEFYQTLLNDGLHVVDLIHGKKILLTNNHKGNGFYFYDISPWVIGYLIGDEWDQDTISYINDTLEKEDTYNGEYVSTTKQSTNFEIMMAKLIEKIVSYEAKKYHTQRLISVNSTFLMDPFQYQEHFAVQIGKLNNFTIDHIKPTSKMKSGLFASYAYEHFDYPLLPLIEPKQLKSYPNVKDYFDLLNKAHKMPVIISSIGYPSDSYLNNEEKQEDILLKQLKMFDKFGYNGSIIRSWQDVWDRRAFETSYAVDLQQIHEWHDPLTSRQHFGLIGFQPYRDNTLMKIDGKNDDWQDVEESFKNGKTKIATTRDHTYLYLWLEDSTIIKDKPFYIAFDTHPKLGNENPNVVKSTFDKKMDFILKVDPSVGAKMYVHERYQSVRQNFLELTNGRNPYFNDPEIDSNKFEAIKFLKLNKKILSEEEFTNRKKVFHYKFEDIHPLKILDEENQELADIAIDNGKMEIRIPYQLLNVYDPLIFTIHDDYYQHFGVEPIQIKHFYLNFSDGNHALSKSIEIQVEPLKSLERVNEYFKPSYYSVKKYWKGED